MMTIGRSLWLFLAFAVSLGAVHPVSSAPMRVVTTLPDYGDLARRIGGERVTVRAIVLGDQDAHFIRPKPSFVTAVARAQVLIATGLDLELWLPTVVNRSGNTRVRSGQIGFVSAAHGMRMLEIPVLKSRVEGGLHVYGNPHVTCSPIQMKRAAHNIAYGFIKNDPDGKEYYLRRLRLLQGEMDRRLFGKTLVTALGGDTLCRLAEKGKLIPFLEKHKLDGRPLVEQLGGWMGRMLPLRGKSIVTYHKNWIYFLELFGVGEGGTVEPKPGIPPSPRHRSRLLRLMRKRGLKIILAASYFNQSLARSVARRVGGVAVIVPVYVGGAPGTESYFKLVDYWIDKLLAAARETGLVPPVATGRLSSTEGSTP